METKMAETNQEKNLNQNHWQELGKSNKEDSANKALVWANEANQSDRHLSNQLTTSVSIFITVGSGFLALTNNQSGIENRIFIFLSLLFFAVSLCSGIIYSLQLTKFFEKASELNSECEGVWANLVNSEDEYEDNNQKSNTIIDNLDIKSPNICLIIQVIFLILGLIFSFVGIGLYMFS